MDMDNDKGGAWSRLLFIAIASVLFGSTMILSAIGPASASESTITPCDDGPLAIPYLA